jgi:hypothetical protein
LRYIELFGNGDLFAWLRLPGEYAQTAITPSRQHVEEIGAISR